MPVLFVLNMVSNNLADLRARAADLEKRVGRKIARTKRERGAVLAGTPFDPRKGAQVARMRSRDVQAHIRKLETMLDRRTQFVGGVGGAPLPVKAWNRFDQSQKALKAKREAELAPFANERLPLGRDAKGKIILADETIAQRQEKIRSPHPTALNQVYTPPTLKPFNIKDLDALSKLTKSNQKRMTKKWAKGEHQRAQVELKKMVEIFRNEDLNAKVATLTYGQFDMIWNLTRFADAMSTGYHSIKAKYDSKQEVPESVIQDQINEANSILDWVKKFKI